MTEYRLSEDGWSTPERESRAAERLELRSEGSTLTLSGYALVYDHRYDIAGGPDNGGFTEIIQRGAAKKSAAEADVKLLVEHAGVPIARTKSGTLHLGSDDMGLRVDAELDPTNPTVAEIRSAMERGDLDEMSFGFRALRQSWSDDYTERTISELKLFDVSLVTFPANPATVAMLRSDVTAPEARTGRSLVLARRQYEALT